MDVNFAKHGRGEAGPVSAPVDHTLASQINAMDLHAQALGDLIEKAESLRREIGSTASNISGADGAEPLRGAGVIANATQRADTPPPPLLPRITEKNNRIGELLSELHNI